MPSEENVRVPIAASVTVSIMHPSDSNPTVSPSPSSFHSYSTTSQEANRQTSPSRQRSEEVFPPLPLTPLHENHLRGHQSLAYEVPGNDHFPKALASRAANGHWMGGQFDTVIVGGRPFTVPIGLLQRHPFWRMMRTVQRPCQGWVMPHEDPKIFAILLECVYSPSGFNGTEGQLNLVKLSLAIIMAKRWDMSNEVQKLEISIRRYIARRILFRNPFLPDIESVMDHNYFVFRSEEIYRTWELCQRFSALDLIISTSELVSLYVTSIPQDLWPALTSNFKSDFTTLIDISSAVRQVPAEQCFEDWWFKFYKSTGYLDYDWFDPLVVERHFFRRGGHDASSAHARSQAEFEAARARGDAIIAAFNLNGQAAARAVAAAPEEVFHGPMNIPNPRAPMPRHSHNLQDDSHGGLSDENPHRMLNAMPNGIMTPERSPSVRSSNEPEVIDIPMVFEMSRSDESD